MKLVFDNWSRGLWVQGPPSKAPKGTLTRCVNMQYTDEGTLTTRFGGRLLYHVAQTTDALRLSDLLFVKDTEGNVYVNGAGTGVVQSGRWLQAAPVTVFGVSGPVVLFPIAQKKWYNWQVSDWGIQDVPSAPTATASATSGALTGVYSYRVAFYNENTKTISAISEASANVSVRQKRITISDLPTTAVSDQVTHVRLYRTLGSIAGQWYFLDQVPLGTTSYDDNMPDTGLGDLIDHNIAAVPVCAVAGRYKNRVVVSGVPDYERYIFYSEASYPEYFSPLNLELVLDSGDVCEALVEMGDYCIVFGRNAIYAVQIPQTGVVLTAKLVSERGTVNGRTVALGGMGLYFTAADGVYVLSGFTAVRVSDAIDGFFRHTGRGGLARASDWQMSSAAFVGGRYYLTYFGDDSRWHTLVYNELKQRWRHNIGWTWVVAPQTGSYPVVGLPNGPASVSVGYYKDDESDIYSECGFNLTMAQTMLHDIRWFRLAAVCDGTIEVSFYDDTKLMYSVALERATLERMYEKHGLPSGVYFTRPEVRLSSNQPFSLMMFECDVFPVRKSIEDYTRQHTVVGATQG